MPDAAKPDAKRSSTMDGALAKDYITRATRAAIIAIVMFAMAFAGSCIFIAAQLATLARHPQDTTATGTMIVGVDAVFGVVMVVLLVIAERVFVGALYLRAVNYWHELATRDTMTGLSNRLAFMQALEEAIVESHETNVRCGVIFVDLNKFKQINDTYGHAAGDHVIIIAARRLRKTFASHDVVARLGGDEFAVLLTRMNEIVASDIIGSIEAAMRAPMQYNGLTLNVSASIGVRLSNEHHHRADDLLHEADVAMYRAKAAQRWQHSLNAKISGKRVRGVRHAAGPRNG